MAYLLSALAAAVYVVATVALARDLRRLAWLACGFELVGVLVVGTASLLLPRRLPRRDGLVGVRAGLRLHPAGAAGARAAAAAGDARVAAGNAAVAGRR